MQEMAAMCIGRGLIGVFFVCCFGGGAKGNSIGFALRVVLSAALVLVPRDRASKQVRAPTLHMTGM